MPINKEGHFEYAQRSDLKVGERMFYLHEDTWNGTPSIRQALLSTRGKLFGLWRQQVFPDANTLNNRFIPMYDDPNQARKDFIEHAQWLFEHLYTDPNRPGDQIGRESVEKGVNHLLRTDWQLAIDETMRELEATLKSIGLNNPPVQEFQLGDRIITTEGHEVIIAEATLWNGSFNPITKQNNPPYIEYIDANGFTVDVLRAA